MNKDDIDRGIGLFQLTEQYLQSISPAESISILLIEASYYGIPLKSAANLHKKSIIQKKRCFFCFVIGFSFVSHLFLRDEMTYSLSIPLSLSPDFDLLRSPKVPIKVPKSRLFFLTLQLKPRQSP